MDCDVSAESLDTDNSPPQVRGVEREAIGDGVPSYSATADGSGMNHAEIRTVLTAYPADCQPEAVEALGSAGGFSGAELWRLRTPRGTLCLRRWPQEYPTPERLEFIQAILWHVWREGFQLVPVPIETRRHAGHVRHSGTLWELSPWMSGTADFHSDPSPHKLKAAMMALARFHRAAERFPLPERQPSISPGILDRLRQVRELAGGGVAHLAECVARHPRPDFDGLAREWLTLSPRALEVVRPELENASRVAVRIQPCIRDIWHDHVLFEGTEVSGIVDFGAMRPESVGADVSRLLRSLVKDAAAMWQDGLAYYRSIRSLAPEELTLLNAFDQSAAVLAAANWIRWIYDEQRDFPNWPSVQARLADSMCRLRHLGSA